MVSPHQVELQRLRETEETASAHRAELEDLTKQVAALNKESKQNEKK